MIALLKKDLLPMTIAGAIGFLLHVLLALFCGPHDLWVVPNDDPAIVFIALLGIWALLFGLFTAIQEDLRRTREYLRFRGLSWRRIFVARQVLALTVVTLVVVLPLALHYAGTLCFSHFGPLVQPERMVLLLGMLSSAYAFYAVGAFAGALSRRLLAIFVVALPAAAGWITLVVVPMDRDLFGMRAVIHTVSGSYVLSIVLVTALLLMGAAAAEGTGQDADHPIASPALFRAVPLALIGVVAFSTLIDQGCLAVGQAALAQRYPEMGMGKDGRGRLITSPAVGRTDDGKLWEADEAHRPRGPLPTDVHIHWSPTNLGHVPLPAWQRVMFNRPLVPLGCGGWAMENECFMLPDGHVLRLSVPRVPSRQTPFRMLLGKEPDGHPFSNDAFALGESFATKTAMIFYDPADQKVWHHELSDLVPLFHPTALPGGDRVLDTLRIAAGAGAEYSSGDLIVRGKKGYYKWTGEGFIPTILPIDPGLPKRGTPPRVREAIVDPLHFRITMDTPQGPFTHDYFPRQPTEKTFARFLYGLTALRPPVLEVASVLFGDPARPRIDRLLNPLVARGTRPWLSGGTLALAGLLAMVTVIRLRRLGGATSHQLFWAGAIILFGVPAFVCHRALVRHRAYAPGSPPVATPVHAAVLRFGEA